MVDFMVTNQWEVFITFEIISFVSLLLFGVVRYILNRKSASILFLLLFVFLLIFEAILALLIYRETGEISTFQIVITVFVVYACTFGIFDFMKLDRWMRGKIGKWRGVELLTSKDRTLMAKQKDPKYVARKNHNSAIIHLIIFALFQVAFWFHGTGGDIALMLDYLKDLSWIGTENYMETPYANETIFGIAMVWGIVFIVDFLYSLSYTFFPSKS
ncbi:hypothetical protein [Oceanobacillus rekensis]|uniref:hypothetical protein n=1 Tax=Oceanobacillus rekensis TaxID=937927 RepID=UPI000B439795|nr:hypothetical protein [Oceanobacillus rekensis]